MLYYHIILYIYMYHVSAPGGARYETVVKQGVCNMGYGTGMLQSLVGWRDDVQCGAVQCGGGGGDGSGGCGCGCGALRGALRV